MAPKVSHSSPTRIMNVRVPTEMHGQLELLAKSTSRTKSFVVLEALSSYLESQNWQIEEIKKGINEADSGKFATSEEVATVFTKYGA